MANLTTACQRAWAPVVDSYDADELRKLVLELRNEVEQLRGTPPNPV